MIRYIRQLCAKLWSSYNHSNIIIPQSVDTDIRLTNNYGSLSFVLDDKDNVDIYCNLAEINEASESEILDVAEKYAKLLLSINKGLFKSDINKILKNRKIKSNNPLEQLYIENIGIFYRLLEQELIKLKSSNDPIIKPSQVFKNS